MATTSGVARTITIDARPFGGGGPVSINLGGTLTEVTYTGTGEPIYSAEPQGWKVTGCRVAIDPEKQDLEFLQDNASGTIMVTCSVEFQDRTSYTGTGKIVGEVTYNSESGMAEFEMKGRKKMEQI